MAIGLTDALFYLILPLAAAWISTRGRSFLVVAREMQFCRLARQLCSAVAAPADNR